MYSPVFLFKIMYININTYKSWDATTLSSILSLACCFIRFIPYCFDRPMCLQKMVCFTVYFLHSSELFFSVFSLSPRSFFVYFLRRCSQTANWIGLAKYICIFILRTLVFFNKASFMSLDKCWPANIMVFECLNDHYYLLK